MSLGNGGSVMMMMMIMIMIIIIIIIIIVLNYIILFLFYRKMYVIMAARSKAWVFGRSLAAIACSNLAWGKDACLLCCVCFQIAVCTTGRSLFQRIPTERGVSECDREPSKTRRSSPIWIWSREENVHV